MTKILSDEEIKTLYSDDERDILGDLFNHFNALQLTHYFDVKDEINRIDSIIMTQECGEEIKIECDSVKDQINVAIVGAGYDAAIRSMSVILGLDYQTLLFAISELDESKAEGISYQEFMKVYESNKIYR